MRLLMLIVAGCLLVAPAFAEPQPEQLTRLQNALHLNAQQMDGWRAYAAAAQPDPRVGAGRESAERMIPGLTTPRRLALMDAVMQESLTDFHRRAAATTAFYNQLSPDQQRTFDRLTAPPAQ